MEIVRMQMPLFKEQKTFISLQLNDIYCNTHNYMHE